MSRKLWSALVAMLLAVCGSVGISPLAAHADSTITTIAWPGVPLPYGMVYTHGNSSVTVASENCGAYSYSDSSTSLATISANGSNTYNTAKTEDNWTIPGCSFQRAVGDDDTVYVVEQHTVTPYGQRVAAIRDSHILWTQSFTSGCSNPAQISNLAVGFDGDLYLEDNHYSGCTQALDLVGLNSATGTVKFTTTLPSTNSSLGTNVVLPYGDGVAVANNGPHVYYYDYTGTAQPGKTFSPSVQSNALFYGAAVTATGRVFLSTQAYVPATNAYDKHLYYKDTSSAIIGEITLPTGVSLGSVLSATPQNGVVPTWVDSSSNSHFGYYNSSGTKLYDQSLAEQAGLSTSSNPKFSVAVDSSGNVIVEKIVTSATSPYDQNVYVDSYDAAGVQTRLFDSAAEFGTAGRDIFTADINSVNSQGVGDGKVYLILCHQIYSSGSLPSTCTSSDSPQLITISTPSLFDYPRSAAFAAISARTQYVALGDSYSSGEGNPPFIAPTDNNGGDGCDRSQSHAYPVLLPADMGFSLRAFVACSGATSDEIYTGLNGEPSQLSSLDANTDIVTVTAGGDDAGFADFAAECVMGTCDAGSSQYQNTMNEINNYLQANLELLFSRIRAAAPNAAIKVVGYPEVVPGSGGSCPTYISGGEQSAIDTVITGLNTKLQLAVGNAGTGFQFIDPTMTGSPFEGHDLCSANPYFFGLNIAEHRFSFHPNADGQAAYEELIANLI